MRPLSLDTCDRFRFPRRPRRAAAPASAAQRTARMASGDRRASSSRCSAWPLGSASPSCCSPAIALAVAYPNLPEIGSLTDYRPKLPMRIFSADGVLLGEFGEERRNFMPIAQIPKVMQDAVLADRGRALLPAQRRRLRRA